MKTTQRGIWVLILMLLVLPQITQAVTDQDVKKSFKVNPGGLLNLETDLGSIEVRTSTANSVDVEVIFKVREHSRRDIEELLKDFDLHKLNIMVGANGAGKSNFVSFFRMLRAMSEEGLANFVTETERIVDILPI